MDTKVQLSATGLSSGSPVQLVWSRLSETASTATSTCWVFVSQPLGSATPSGGSFHSKITVPDGLGGWHVVQVVQKGKILAEVPFYVMESIVGKGLSSVVVKEGQPFTIHLEGVGWTQLDNTVTVDYDNSYIGYGCGFNSNGDVLLHLNATGGPGTHLIDLYPMLYSLSPSFGSTPTAWCRFSPTPRTIPDLHSATTCPCSGSRSPSSSSRRSRTCRQVLPLVASERRDLHTGESGEGRGSHQFQRPSSVIRLGINRPRTIVASMMTPSASPAPISCSPATCPATSPESAPTMIKAAALTTRPVWVSPSDTADLLSLLTSQAPRIRSDEEDLVVHREAEGRRE